VCVCVCVCVRARARVNAIIWLDYEIVPGFIIIRVEM
jgi:hypothetical protein